MPYAIMNEGEHVDGWATWRPSDRRRRERRLPSRSGYVAVRYVGVPQPLPNVEPSSILVPRSSVQRLTLRCAIRKFSWSCAWPRGQGRQGRGGQREQIMAARATGHHHVAAGYDVGRVRQRRGVTRPDARNGEGAACPAARVPRQLARLHHVICGVFTEKRRPPRLFFSDFPNTTLCKT